MATPQFDSVLGRVPSGIFILTAGAGDRATGMLASWVMQAGFEPPMVSVAVKKERYLADWISEGQPFVLNLVGEDQAIFLKHFGKGFEPNEPAFEGVATRSCPTGVPALADALGYLECEPDSHIDSGDHRIFLARIVRGDSTGEGKPMVHIRKSGSRY